MPTQAEIEAAVDAVLELQYPGALAIDFPVIDAVKKSCRAALEAAERVRKNCRC